MFLTDTGFSFFDFQVGIPLGLVMFQSIGERLNKVAFYRVLAASKDVRSQTRVINIIRL